MYHACDFTVACTLYTMFITSFSESIANTFLHLAAIISCHQRAKTEINRSFPNIFPGSHSGVLTAFSFVAWV